MGKKSEKDPEAGIRNSEECGMKREPFPGQTGSTVDQVLCLALEKTDPAVKENNPVISWAVYPDHAALVFRDGRKVTISY